MAKLIKSDGRYLHWCPGCKEVHSITVHVIVVPSWTFNGNYEFPTFGPSQRHRSIRPADDTKGISSKEYTKCRYFITYGFIEFCADCDHELSGQRVELPCMP